MSADINADSTVYAALKSACPKEWHAYTHHDFVDQLSRGTLPEASFRHYLQQDYLFLFHFSRAWALAAVKSEHLDELRHAASTLDALINHEMGLHVQYCAKWNLSEDEMAAIPESESNMAYTRFVLERGMAGDLLDLLVALAPCAVGYAEIGARLAADPATKRQGNPYSDWIDVYSGTEFQDVAASVVALTDRVAARRLGKSDVSGQPVGAHPFAQSSPRWPSLCATFRAATSLEIGFWEMGLHPPAANPA